MALPNTPSEHDEHSLLATNDVPRRPQKSVFGRADITTVALFAILAVLVYGTLRVLWPYVTALVLAAWGAHLTRPLFRRIADALHGRERAAALCTAIFVVLLLLPFVFAIATVVPAAAAAVEQLRASGSGREALESIVGGDGGAATPNATSIVKLVREYGPSASRALALIGGASTEALIGAFVFFVAYYAGLMKGHLLSAWLEKNALLEPATFVRLRDSFFQAGRGLLIGNGLTALAQGSVATITYIALGVPRALALGVLSIICALIPLVGATIVWIPVALGLLLTGHPAKAAILAGVGLAVISTIDNLLRPYLARRAHVGLDTSVVLVSMFGGIALLGAWGLFLGPLIVRLAVEVLAVVRERRTVTARMT